MLLAFRTGRKEFTKRHTDHYKFKDPAEIMAWKGLAPELSDVICFELGSGLQGLH